MIQLRSKKYGWFLCVIIHDVEIKNKIKKECLSLDYSLQNSRNPHMILEITIILLCLIKLIRLYFFGLNIVQIL